MREVVIASAVRTPIGAFGGKFKDVSAVQLGTIVAKEALKRAKVDPNMVDEVIFGNVDVYKRQIKSLTFYLFF